MLETKLIYLTQIWRKILSPHCKGDIKNLTRLIYSGPSSISTESTTGAAHSG